MLSLIGDEDAGGLWIGLEGLHDVSGKVVIACVSVQGWASRPARWPRRGWHANGCRAMPLVLEFLALDVTGLHGQGEVQTCQGLDASHAHRYSSHACRPRAGRRRCLVDLAYRGDLRSQFSGVVVWRSKRVA